MSREITYHKDGAVSVGTPGFTGEQPTLRDFFAMSALSGLLAADPERYIDPQNYWAKDAYAHADAMLKARENSNV
jgi:hypothetical protein